LCISIEPQSGIAFVATENTAQTLRRSDHIRPAILVTSAASAVIRLASIRGMSILLGDSNNPFGFV
jgi:hypothetical protein